MSTEAPSPRSAQRFLARLCVLLVTAVLVLSTYPSAVAELPAMPAASVTPVQSAAAGTGPWQNGDYSIRPLARYDVTARVLSTRSYSGDREAEVSPIDFALGWGPMADREMLSQLTVEQRDRWYFVRWRNAPIRASDVIQNSANTHLLPASPEVAEMLENVQPGDMVTLRGYLVQVRAEDGWTWTSSTVRTDTGDGSCEVLWIESVEIHSDAPIAYASLD